MNSRPTIAVVGASVRATAFSLLRAGSQVVAADLFADADLTRVCPATRIDAYTARLVDWLSEVECAGWVFTGALENHPDLIDQMAKLRPLFGNSGEVLRRVRDPLLLQQELTKAGFSFPETRPCDGRREPGIGDWLHKTGQGAGGSGVEFPKRLTAYDAGYWQRQVEGIPGSAQFVGPTLRGITRQLIGQSWTGASGFTYCGTLAPWPLPSDSLGLMAKLGQHLAYEFQLRGLYGVDFVFDGEQIWILEVNPRPTAAIEVIEHVTGQALLAEHLSAFGIEIAASLRPHVPAAGKAIVYARRSLTISQMMSERLLALAGSMPTPALADIPAPGTKIEEGHPILTVLADGADIAGVEAKLRAYVEELERNFYGGSP